MLEQFVVTVALEQCKVLQPIVLWIVIQVMDDLRPEQRPPNSLGHQ
jgi:hypothetical protein